MKCTIRAERIWDGVADTYIPNREIHVSDGRIVEKPVRGDEINLDGYALMPGLINAHCHLILHGDLDIFKVIMTDSQNRTAIKTARNAYIALLNGITTVRDLGDKNMIVSDLARLIENGELPGPRILYSGYPICMTGGHGWFFGREADGPDECRKAAREQLKAGAHWIKLMATGGILTPGVSPESFQLNEDEMRAAIEEAHKAEKRTATHAQGAMGVKLALKAGIDTVEHGFFIDDEAIELFLKNDAWLVPTLNAPQMTIEAEGRGIPDYVIEKAKKVQEGFLDRLEKAIKAGVKIGAGSDAGTPLNGHDLFWREIVNMSGTSLGNLKALKCATSINAELLGLEKEIGRIAPGYVADLIAVKGDPIKDPSVLSNVHWVMKSGKIIKDLTSKFNL
jgi:imidazolonepropionase-like amidohydrolase